MYHVEDLVASFAVLSQRRVKRRHDDRRRFDSVMPRVFPGLFYIIYGIFVSALRRWASICQSLVLCLFRVQSNPFSACRRSVSVCEYSVVWRPDAVVGLIWNCTRRCDGRCRDAQR